MVLAISAAEAKLFVVEDCHLMTLPVLPLKDRVALLPVQIVVLPVRLPPTDTGLTVTATETREAEGHELEFVVHEISA